MRDIEKDQWPPYPKTESNVTKRSRTILGSSDNRSKSNPVQNGNRVHQRREISPPLLKRRRSAYEESHRGHGPATLITPSTTSSLCEQPINVSSNRKPFARPLQTLDSVQAPHSTHAQQTQIRGVSSLRKPLGLSKPLSKSESCKPACQVCDKTTATSYNPIITCPGCARLYHDGCRKPMLAQGVDPQQWRCLACLSSGKPTKSMLLSKSVPVRSSVVRNISKPLYALSSIVDSTKLSGRTAFLKNVHAQTSRAGTTIVRRLGSLDRPKEDSESSLQSGHSNNLSTPARCSAQFPPLESSFLQHNQAEIGLTISNPSVQMRSHTPMVLCSGCRQVSVFVRSGVEDPQCQICQNEFRVGELRCSEIPETPNAATCYDIPSVMSSTESAASTNAHSPAAGVETSSWFNLDRTSTLDRTSIEPLHDKQQRDKDQSKFGTSNTIQKRKLSASVSPIIHETEETQIRLAPRCHHRRSISDATARVSGSEQQEPDTMGLESSPASGHSSISPEISASLEVDDASSSMRQRRHTNRELAIIALACANGSSMSAPQIVDWLVERFPYLRQGQGSWKKSFKTTLSLKEFRSTKAVGLDDVRVVYSFANEAYKTRYEEEYRDYITECSHRVAQQRVFEPAVAEPTGSVCETVESTTEQHSSDHLGETVENASARHAKDSQGNAARHPVSSQHPVASSTVLYTGFIPSPASTSSEDSTSPNSSKPCKLALAKDKANCVLGIKRETSFDRAYRRGAPPSIETMTAEEKARKVAEIRARPSRKQLFDSGQRLAHVRKYKRQDPHDESEGAWKPPSVGVKEKPMEEKGITNNCGEPQSLREAFGLPANPVPMLHEGNELAFRDGTMVNGRLPRPRRIYRVGKRLGAGLTVN